MVDTVLASILSGSFYEDPAIEVKELLVLFMMKEYS